jgi:hypothetical protein
LRRVSTFSLFVHFDSLMVYLYLFQIWGSSGFRYSSS